jgi:hypothetical protein
MKNNLTSLYTILFFIISGCSADLGTDGTGKGDNDDTETTITMPTHMSIEDSSGNPVLYFIGSTHYISASTKNIYELNPITGQYSKDESVYFESNDCSGTAYIYTTSQYPFIGQRVISTGSGSNKYYKIKGTIAAPGSGEFCSWYSSPGSCETGPMGSCTPTSASTYLELEELASAPEDFTSYAPFSLDIPGSE